MTDMVQDGIVLGRFQPLHKGHVEYLDVAKARCRVLYIGITNPDPESRIFSAADSRRSLSESNPFTYLERLRMIHDTLRACRWKDGQFYIVPAPVLEPDRMAHYLPSPRSARVFVTIYDDWGEQKARVLRDMGYSVEVLWRRNHADREASGAEIRASIQAHSSNWHKMVPAEVVHHVEALRYRVVDHGA